VVLLLALACGHAARTAPAHAQAKPARLPEDDLLPAGEGDDPIGVDAESRGLERDAAERARAAQPPPPAQVSAERARFGPLPPPLDARKGEALTGSASTRELAHRVRVTLEPGVTSVQVEMEFESRAQKPSELRYRLAVPEGSALSSLEVCNAAGCRSGLPEPVRGELGAYEVALLSRHATGERALPIARAADTRDARGAAITVHAAPIAAGKPLRVRVAYETALPLHGGVARLVLPARGMDPQAAPGELTITAPRLIDVRADGQPVGEGAQRFEPWVEVPIDARAKSGDAGRASALSFACGAARCARADVWSGPGAQKPAELVIALDLSPSTEGPARSRSLAAIAALLEAAPEGSRVRALAFAARAEPLIETAMAPSQVELAPFARAIAEAELGSATRFEAVWRTARGWLDKRGRGALRPLIVLVGDGGLTEGDQKAFDEARRAGVEVAAIDLAERSATPALRGNVWRTGGVIVDAGAEAELAARRREVAPLRARLSALFAPTLGRVSVRVDGRAIELGPLRAGESLTWQGRARSLSLLGGAARSRTATQAERGQALALGALALARAPASADKSGRTGEPARQIALLAIDARDLDLARRAQWPERPPPATPGRKPAFCDRRGPAQSHSGISSDAQPVALAEERVCKAAPVAKVGDSGAAAEIGAGMPADPLLSMLRQRIMPLARGCFRRDRAGRANYKTRAVFVFALAEREVVDARVEGAIADDLRRCLLAAVDTLEVPRFSGVVKARYPLVTEAVPLPEQIELRSETAGDIDRLFHDPRKDPQKP
jgi:hypothetical protein